MTKGAIGASTKRNAQPEYGAGARATTATIKSYSSFARKPGASDAFRVLGVRITRAANRLRPGTC